MQDIQNQTQNTPNDADIIIIGGGMNGLTLSLLLGNAGFTVLCLDAAAHAPSDSDKRTTAISYGSHQILNSAGIWDDIYPYACPIHKIDILDGNSPVLLDFDSQQDFKQSSQENNIEAFGWIVENTHLLNTLKTALKNHKNITHQTNQKVANIEFHQNNATVTTENNQSVQKNKSATLVVGADGRQSFTRKAANIKSKQWSYNQKAIICCAQHENPHNNIAIEHFRSDGPFAILPMLDDAAGNHQSAVVWTLESDMNDAMLNNIDIINAALNERFPQSYGTIKLASTPRAYPLNFNHAYNYIAHRVVLVGDAAHGIHPIAGQGLNIGLQDVRLLSELLTALKDNKSDIGLVENLKPYQQQRLPENTLMAAATDGLNRVFSNNKMASKIIRKTGLKLVEKLPASKRFFVKKAMGIPTAIKSDH